MSVGSLVSCYTKLIKIGRTSLQILVEVWATPAIAPQQVKVTEGLFTFVAIDENRRTRAVPKKEQKI